jgi:hypothetical protein
MCQPYLKKRNQNILEGQNADAKWGYQKTNTWPVSYFSCELQIPTKEHAT